MNTRIRRRDFLKNIGTGAVLLAASSRLWADITNISKQLNIILIIGDDISVDDFGCYGHPHIRTPNIDKLAQTGVRFTNAYLTCSQCSPTRCSVISGRYPHNTGAPELHLPLPADQPMFPLLLKEAGYYTAAAGKWHLGDNAKIAFNNISDSRPGGEEHWISTLQNRPKDKPFFMWFASHDAHRSWQEDPEGRKHANSDAVIPPYMADTPGTREDLANYYNEIQRLDRYVGKVIEELKEQEVYDNTIIIFIADNGRPFPRCKTWVYDSGIKTPFIVRHPQIKSNNTCDSLLSVIDIAPTILSWAGVGIPAAMQGVNFQPLLDKTKTQIREYAFAEQNWHDIELHQRIVRWQNYVYIRNARPQLSAWAHAHAWEPPYVDLRAMQKKGELTEAQADIFRVPRPPEMLFDVSNDYHELKDLAGDPNHQETLEHLRKIMDQWQDRTGDTVPEKLTGDYIDRETLQWQDKNWRKKMTRGTIPGSERNAAAINDPGPR